MFYDKTRPRSDAAGGLREVRFRFDFHGTRGYGHEPPEAAGGNLAGGWDAASPADGVCAESADQPNENRFVYQLRLLSARRGTVVLCVGYRGEMIRDFAATEPV
jgi:hypothetical protein